MLKSVHAKLLAPILCAIVISSLVTGIFGHRVASGIVINAFEEDGLRSARNLRERIDLVISKSQLDLLALSVAPTVRQLLLEGGSPDLLEEYMKALVAQYGIYNSIIILDTNGIIVASTSGSTGEGRGDRGYFQASLRGEFYIGEVEQSRQTGRLATFISIPVLDGEEEPIIGVAMTALRLEELNSRHVISVNLLGDHGYAMIATSAGTLIGHRHEDEIGQMLPAQTLAHLALINEGGSSAAFETTLYSERFMVFAERSFYTDWFAIVVSPVSEFYTATNFLATFTAVLAVLLILAQAVVIWVVVRGITTALTTTVRYSEDIANGRLDAPLAIKRNDEVGVLAQSLRDMVDKLRSMIDIAEEKTAEAQASAETIMEGIKYASKIQKNLLPVNNVLEAAFSDYSVIWEPRDVVGGDIYWMKRFDNKGAVFCICDCTGHGTSGALLTMLVVSELESSVNLSNCHDTAYAIWRLEQRLVDVFNVRQREGDDIKDGCDLAVVFLANDGSVTLSAGNLNVFTCDGTKVRRIKGQRIFVGEGKLESKKDIQTINLSPNPADKFYIASDGLFDQPGGECGTPFGYGRFEKIILQHHDQSQPVISGKIWDAFEAYRGVEPRVDDFALLTFKP